MDTHLFKTPCTCQNAYSYLSHNVSYLPTVCSIYVQVSAYHLCTLFYLMNKACQKICVLLVMKKEAGKISSESGKYLLA